MARGRERERRGRTGQGGLREDGRRQKERERKEGRGQVEGTDLGSLE
jgi:hypothetical protein